MMRASPAIGLSAVCVLAAACATAPPQQQNTATVTTQTQVALRNATPPPPVSTPVPIVKAHVVPSAGRPDPFIALYGPAQPAPPPQQSKKSVSASSFPNIPTLPGFEGPPGAQKPPSIWDGVHLTGVLRSGGYVAILVADGKSYIVKPGDFVADKFRVVAIGPDSITLATAKERRHLTLGG